MERSFIEAGPGQGVALQTVMAPPEPEYGMPASTWTVRETLYAWEVVTDLSLQPAITAGVARPYWTAYFVPADVGRFISCALVPTSLSDYFREASERDVIEATLVRCPKLRMALENADRFQLQQDVGPMATTVQPANRLAAFSGMFSTASVKHPPDVGDRFIRQVSWGAITWAWEISDELRNAVDSIVGEALLHLPRAKEDKAWEIARRIADKSQDILGVIKDIASIFGQ